MKKQMLALLLLVVVLLTASVVAAQEERHVFARLQPVGDSGVTGIVNLVQLANDGGTRINVVAFGLEAGNTYVSLYYDNHECDLEPYSEDDVIGDPYTANRGTHGATHGIADDALDEINSVSVRSADDFTLLACADVHPDE